jgi:phosphoglucomutase
MRISPLAGKPAPLAILVDVSKLIHAYYEEIPDPLIAAQRVEFGTSGHRGSSLRKSFNEQHILAIAQAICLYRAENGIYGPLFLGLDTHALSLPALQTALEVFIAHGVTVMLAENDEFTPTPAISHAILQHNLHHKQQIGDGIVITPSHNPPEDGGIKYNPPHGGPAGPAITKWIEVKANELLEKKLEGVQRIPFEKAVKSPNAKRYNYLDAYVKDLGNVLDMEAIRDSKIHIGVDPLGGAGVHYWRAIASYYKLNLTITNEIVDPTFKFMTVDWDGQIRMDPSSAYAMERLIAMKERFDVAVACDTDYDRHGIVTKSSGLLAPNHYLAAAIFYLFHHRPQWRKDLAIGKTFVSSQIIDKIALKLNRKIYEVPVGFKWFVEGLLDASLGFVGEESAGGAFLRLDGTPWTTDKDGIILALLAAEITAVTKKDPGQIYQELAHELGNPFSGRVEAVATDSQKKVLKNLSLHNFHAKELAGEKITSILVKAPSNNASLEGLKVVTKNGWFAARPSGTENIYKIYGESFLSDAHLKLIFKEAQAVVDKALQ